MLDRGPNPGDVTALWAAGALPPNATEIWPGLNVAEVPLLRLPYELREGADDRRSLRQLSHDELMELWETYGFEPARELLADQIVYDYEHMTALRDFNLKINLAYMFAMAHGLPEWTARRLAKIHPETLVDFVQPLSAPAELAYALTVEDLVDAVRDDVWSWRTLGEVAMVLPYGRLGKIGKIDDAIDAMDDLRDARRAADAADNSRMAKIGVDDLTPVQQNNLQRYVKRLPAGAEQANIIRLSDGSVEFSAKVPGRVPGSYAVYTKTVDSVGDTVSYTKTTYAPDGEIVHRKDKFQRGY
jgi:hypothetical protein